ncbi:MAG TPA: DUF5615 family PIN-like protein [Dehalococcoidia bacterium]|nr:DUF5615 family PIN-like protein [Dehalococcoidia bacterium]
MRFLLDQNFDRRLVPRLREAGHDVAVVGIHHTPGLPDVDVLMAAHQEGRILLTNDRDFGDLVVRRCIPHAGVIYLRMRRSTAEAKWQRLSQVLHDNADSLSRFLVVTDGEVRVR